MSKTKIICLIGLIVLAGGMASWVFRPNWAEAGKVVFKRNVIVRAFYKLTQNGSAGSLVADYGFYTQAKGGVDDYNNNGTIPADSYSTTFITCAVGNNYCGTNDAAYANKKDASTGLTWSIWLGSGTTYTWFAANNCYEPGTAENPGTCVNNGDDACQCVKKTSSKVGCESIGDGNWRLPHQKELMQVYIDGSWGNLSDPYAFWSATTRSYGTQGAWYVYLGYGGTGSSVKTTSASYQVRCVR